MTQMSFGPSGEASLSRLTRGTCIRDQKALLASSVSSSLEISR